MSDDYNRDPLSRNEEILRATIDGTDYDRTPMSAEEQLLVELKEKIEKGGGGGTTDYNDLINKPTIGGKTLEGDLSMEDIGGVPIADSDIENAVNEAFGNG